LPPTTDFGVGGFLVKRLLPLFIATFGLFFTTNALGAIRAKDLASFHGVRNNPLSGVGLVVGLNRTGDSRRNEASVRALANRLRGMGVNLQLDDIQARNVSLVMVSTNISAHHRTGSVLDVTVASVGDATSLEGGLLLPTLLIGLDGNVYAVAQGSLVVGGFQVGGGGSSTRKNTPTTARLVSGAHVEREVSSNLDFNSMETVDLILKEPDFTTAVRLGEAIDGVFDGAKVAFVVDSATLQLTLPDDFRGKFPSFAMRVEAVLVEVDAPARVVINERTGTVVMGAEVQVSAVAVAHGGLSIEVQRSVGVSQPAPLSAGQTAVISETSVSASEEDGQLRMVEGVSIGDLVAALNNMGVKPRDLIVILQAIRAAGALHAEIVAL
jgi:flagellar P-ring protein precursor FlgI